MVVQRSDPELLKRCDDLLTRDAVASLLRTYKPAVHVGWSATRVLHRLGVTKSKSAPNDIKRRANAILEELAAEGLLRPKGDIRGGPAECKFFEKGWVRAPEVGA